MVLLEQEGRLFHQIFITLMLKPGHTPVEKLNRKIWIVSVASISRYLLLFYKLFLLADFKERIHNLTCNQIFCQSNLKFTFFWNYVFLWKQIKCKCDFRTLECYIVELYYPYNFQIWYHYLKVLLKQSFPGKRTSNSWIIFFVWV